MEPNIIQESNRHQNIPEGYPQILDHRKGIHPYQISSIPSFTPVVTILVTSLSLGVMLGVVITFVSRIYGNLSDNGKVYIWVAGFFYPGVTALITVGLTFAFGTPVSCRIFLIGNSIALMVIVIITGCAIIGS
ncbi:MAG: hypothetical protein ACTSYI_08845 [Promethearchaeota archaeon]